MNDSVSRKIWSESSSPMNDSVSRKIWSELRKNIERAFFSGSYSVIKKSRRIVNSALPRFPRQLSVGQWGHVYGRSPALERASDRERQKKRRFFLSALC